MDNSVKCDKASAENQEIISSVIGKDTRLCELGYHWLGGWDWTSEQACKSSKLF